MLLALSLLIAPTADAADMKLLDSAYTSALCSAWNTTALPQKLGRSGSAWVDSAGSKGSQIIVINRRDCSDWKAVQLHIKADESGAAKCVEGGTFAGGDFQWRFQPTTEQWADFTDGFGVMQMPGIMDGFKGPYPTAAANVANFEIFFALAGKIALENQVDWTCAGADADAVVKELKSIDQSDMKSILAP